MKFQLITQAPLWWLSLCILAGFFYAFILYRKTGSARFAKSVRALLFSFRFIAVTVLCFLLLTPLIRTASRETEKPLLIFAQDNSTSLTLKADSLFYKKQYPEDVRSFLRELDEKYEVVPLSWGDRVNAGLDFTYTDKQTDFSSLFREINIRYGNRNVGALVIASDGLYNRGTNPIFDESGLNIPYYTIGLGDTNVRKDVFLSRINYNKKVFLGNSFPVEINLGARQFAGNRVTLNVRQGEAVRFARQVQLTSNSFSQTIPVILEATQKGIQHYTIEVSSLDGEITYTNNQQDIYVEVLESKQKILLISAAPHPDIAALREAVESSQNYELIHADADKIPASVREYNLVILHNLPTAKYNLPGLYTKLLTDEIPVLFVVGMQTDLNQFNALKSLLSIKSSLDKASPASAAYNSLFSLFGLSDETKSMIPRFPPLLTPFGSYVFSVNNYVLLYQQIGAIKTDNPLIAFSGSADLKAGVICGEGLWRWRMTDYSENGNFNAFNEIIQKSIQNLALRESKSRFRIQTKSSFDENEQVVFDAELYNANYELINTPDLNISLTGKDGKTYPFTFNRTDNSYHLNAGFLPPGNYRYKSTVNAGDQVFSREGAFSIVALQAEQAETVADHQLLYNLAKKQGGEFYGPEELDKLKAALLSREDIKTVVYSHMKLQDLLNRKEVFFLILALLSLEWFLRKRSGSY